MQKLTVHNAYIILLIAEFFSKWQYKNGFSHNVYIAYFFKS